jgi:transcriptional regulator with XRE-family HTH domain
MKSQLPETQTQRLGRILAAQRQANGRSIEETAAYLGISSEELKKIETGEVSPGLPVLETLARLFNVPLDMLLLNQPDQEENIIGSEKIPAVIALRNRIIAVMIKRTRVENDRSLEDIAATINIEPAKMEEYESGRESIPLPHLEGICSALGISLKSLATGLTSQVAKEPVSESENIEEFPQLPRDLREFILNNSNLPYLQLAKRLSEMDAAKLRNIAEGLLEITY